MITQQELKQLLHYDPETGIFTWKSQNKKRPGKLGRTAGTHDEMGYVYCNIHKKKYRLHRLAWLYMTGGWPTDLVDHDDRVRDNNKWDNLKPATKLSNSKNANRSKRNKSGHTAIFRTQSAWGVNIGYENKVIHVGSYHTIEEALTARNDKYKELNYHPNHGK